MNNRKNKILLIGLLTAGALFFAYYKLREQWNYKPEETLKSGNLHGYNELANEDSLIHYTTSEYNTDLPHVTNIKRPEESQIIDPTIDTLLLFKIWASDPNGPHADFHLSKKHFYMVDYDGNGRMPYILKNDSLTIFYNDFIQKGRIIKVTKDNLTIKWNDTNSSTEYVEWKN